MSVRSTSRPMLIVDVDDHIGSGRASATWNALMTHVHHESTLRALGEGAAPLFTVGGRYEADLSRTADGWRISRVSVRVIWTAGQPPLGVSG